MPARRPSYPYIEPAPAGRALADIEGQAEQNAADWGYEARQSLDEVARKAGVDIEYSHDPNEILLEVPLDQRPVVWLPRQGRKREDRVTIATALGYWSLHVENTQASNPSCGIQALYEPEADKTLKEATTYALAFLMPREEFRKTWTEGRSQLVSDHFDVPTKFAYLRAEGLGMGELT